MNRYLKDVDPAVCWGSAVLIAGFVAWGLVAPDNLGTVMGEATGWVVGNFGWAFILIATGVLLLCLYLALSPWGKIKLGPDDSTPDFRTFSWVSMMFAAGLGAGLLFYGIAEPVTHWANPPHGLAEPESEEAALTALRYTYFHWGFNGWAMYAVLGGAMAYFAFRKDQPVLVSATFTPILGPDAHQKPIGRLVDALAIVATLFGTATALGLNGLQLNSGLDYLLDVPKSNGVAVAIIVVVTGLFILSATSGVEKGINFLANLGSVATIVLFLFFLVVGGSTVLVISNGIESIGDYVIQVIPMSLETGVGDEKWMANWTIFYWAWWVSWAPFVGMFVARISRGRTIREFIVGVVAAPTGFGFIWFAIVGGTGIELQRSGEVDVLGAPLELSLFTALDVLPLPVISSALCIILIALFFISGADAASVVMATMASRGSITPSRIVVVVLGVLMGGIACAMLLVGGLTALQQAAVLGSVPFTVVLVGVAYCWVKALREEGRTTPATTEQEHETTGRNA
ncbi:BCCT family transporter [Nocardioides lianchengensis]|uniref:Choline/carnitine/betaine transport n=1 Tax=Nocardioides lianchengensis TaxID=1045774 RepID=A0A1G6PPB6_9ACTN|nr:BCCT family transporter [Nocardioides lianchengensis]NYG11933.1 choline/carnitine/betaine transport [Nocardioides lianchengensis]SDC82092.1 choline/carnitine/betaine transport [Nocardioides lianchengensis]